MAPRTASLAVALALALAPAAARAQARDPAAAEGLFQAGKSEMEAGRLDQACALFRQSREADGAPGTTFHLADCEEKRGKLATAWALFVEAAQRLPAGDARISVVRARAAALEPRLSHLAIDVARDVPGGTEVDRDGVPLGVASGTFLPVDAGRHVVVVRAPGHADRTFEVVLVERERRRLPVSTGARVDAASSGAAIAAGGAAAGAPDAPPPASALPTVGIVVAGVGVAAIVAGVAVALTASADYEDSAPFCDGDRCTDEGLAIRDDARTLGTVATALTVAGAIGAGAGVTLWLITAPSKSAPAQAGRVALGASLRGVDVRGSF